MADIPPSSADVTESGNLNLPEPSGPHRPLMGMLYLTRYYIQILMKLEFSRQILENINTKFHENQSNGAPVVPRGQADRRTGQT
jgi:hypothetical protein